MSTCKARTFGDELTDELLLLLKGYISYHSLFNLGNESNDTRALCYPGNEVNIRQVGRFDKMNVRLQSQQICDREHRIYPAVVINNE